MGYMKLEDFTLEQIQKIKAIKYVFLNWFAKNNINV